MRRVMKKDFDIYKLTAEKNSSMLHVKAFVKKEI